MNHQNEHPVKNSRDKVELGISGENAAAEFLKEKGYNILKRNKRIGHSDIDILAEDGETLVFVEVRTKSKTDRGMPEETLSKKKLLRMEKTAQLYMAFNQYEGLARLDAVCIVIDKKQVSYLEHYIGVN